MQAAQKTNTLIDRLARRGVLITFGDANALRRAAIVLTRWAEAECGNSDSRASWAIERDETTNVPYLVVHPHDGTKQRRRRIADRENGAIKRVTAICKEYDLVHYRQTDPRGCSLYVGRQVDLSDDPIDQAYDRLVCCEVAS